MRNYIWKKIATWLHTVLSGLSYLIDQLGKPHLIETSSAITRDKLLSLLCLAPGLLGIGWKTNLGQYDRASGSSITIYPVSKGLPPAQISADLPFTSTHESLPGSMILESTVYGHSCSPSVDESGSHYRSAPPVHVAL